MLSSVDHLLAFCCGDFSSCPAFQAMVARRRQEKLMARHDMTVTSAPEEVPAAPAARRQATGEPETGRKVSG